MIHRFIDQSIDWFSVGLTRLRFTLASGFLTSVYNFRSRCPLCCLPPSAAAAVAVGTRATVPSGIGGAHQSEPHTPVLDWFLAGEEDERGKRRDGTVRTLPCPSAVAFILHVATTTTTDAVECMVQTATDHLGGAFASSPSPRKLISRWSSSGHYDRLLIVAIERHFHLVLRSVSAPRASPDVMLACFNLRLLTGFA